MSAFMCSLLVKASRIHFQNLSCAGTDKVTFDEPFFRHHSAVARQIATVVSSEEMSNFVGENHRVPFGVARMVADERVSTADLGYPVGWCQPLTAQSYYDVSFATRHRRAGGAEQSFGRICRVWGGPVLNADRQEVDVKAAEEAGHFPEQRTGPRDCLILEVSLPFLIEGKNDPGRFCAQHISLTGACQQLASAWRSLVPLGS
ncbi:MAG: hypothetical protein V3V86_06185 [Gammaproteobacteria bacterium]